MQYFWPNTWRTGALAVVVVVAVINVIHLALAVPPPPVESPAAAIDPAMRAEHRLAPLRASVRRHGLRGTIGYVGELRGGRLNDDPRAVEDYYRTQFALVPLVLDPNPAPYVWAVANLHATASAPPLPAGWTIAENLGDGVLLLRKEAP